MPSPFDRVLKHESTLASPVSEIWDLWTTEKGIHAFFSKNCYVGAAPDDPYEIYFDLSAPRGSKGSEGCRILRKEPKTRFAFTWNAPPHLNEVRNQRTVVEIQLQEMDGQKTRFTFTHAGWGAGEQWDKAYHYFENAWFNIVLPRFEKALRGENPWD